ncbi:glycosyltransferase involved in cell wall biosynthesis [Mesoflavibacter sabulilitoris]|uniref:Glycosyltransferase 2-like domain-containing protein n=1 Tax=Mesoflavibacter zeaxanthinifaciens subsp. sabulilitoris TaxID=1520893 RepID=A0A2T1NB12_9FLAO|nr:glycosyltransferase family A protein [Mesoflavibacter zeaxanthinifaciens]MBB3123540.1 glycosyltransferase involved in cell wall biosynthesis [Mesoflavibacter zeaxanthinifaciens subsp. sabulilitoris]PSG89329.1 hypothetical protein C7H61_10275 [Mesoflavibacter zeaxanthinifaciens subsp. sabulilitoris]
MVVSIIIPVHKTIPYFKDCVLSALSQSYKDIEVIIACNHTLTRKACEEFLAIKDTRLVFIETKKGRHHARNEALQIAKGDYIQFLDYDDYLYPEKISLHLKAFVTDNKHLAVGLCQWKKFTNHINEAYSFPFSYLFTEQPKHLLDVIELLGEKGGFVATIAWLFPKDLIKNIKWIDAPNDDAVFISDLIKKKPEVSLINSTLAGYRIHDFNTSTLTEKKELDLLLKGWQHISINLKTYASVKVYQYLYRAYVIILKQSKVFNYYKYFKVLMLVISYGFKSKQSFIKILKDIKRSLY